MSEYTLTLVDTGAIQGYVFGTNNLQQISGASYLVDCVTNAWLINALTGFHTNLQSVHDLRDLDQPFNGLCIEDGQIDAELIYWGGGNAALLFTHIEKAVEFTRALTDQVLRQAPGLKVVISHTPVSWDQPLGGERGGFYQAQVNLQRRKVAIRPLVPLLGLGVTAQCVFTGQPAVGVDVQGRLVSLEAKTRAENASAAWDRLLNRNYINLQGFDNPPKSLDELGQSRGEKSLLAVVHIDGNRMGDRIEAIGRRYASSQQNRDYLNARRAFSLSIHQAARKGLQAAVDILIGAVDPYTQQIQDRIAVKENRLPFRPIVFGGDDVTFVCDGRLGLSLAHKYLEALFQQQLSDGLPFDCRAGVAIVRSHYPFARAYELAEHLCASASERIRAVKVELEAKGIDSNVLSIAAIDWHLTTSGLDLDLSTIRTRQYDTDHGSLLARPLIVQIALAGNPPADRPNEDWRSWENFSAMLYHFTQSDEWRDMRNKLKALRTVLRDGPDAVKRFSELIHPTWPKLSRFSDAVHNMGWYNNRCLYFDAIEASDAYIDL